MSESTSATTCVGVVTPQYSQRLLRPRPNRPRPIPSVVISGVRVHPTASRLSRPSGSVRETGEVISRSGRVTRGPYWPATISP